MSQNAFNFIGRRAYTFMNCHVEPMDALSFRAYREDSKHALQCHDQYVLVLWHFNKEQLKLIEHRKGVNLHKER